MKAGRAVEGVERDLQVNDVVDVLRDVDFLVSSGEVVTEPPQK
jgi:hypothetical protein